MSSSVATSRPAARRWCMAAADARRLMESGSHIGKILLRVAD
jgi:hypothetical protein